MTSNINISRIREIVTPNDIINRLPNNSSITNNIITWRQSVEDILNGNDRRLLVIVGPCSIHDPEAAIFYAKKLKELSLKYEKRLFIVMRVYFEKPRTTIGWKGLINDPDLDNTFNINKGIKIARQLLLEINNIGIPVGCEFLDVFTPQYYSDLVTWGAIGARTTESQLHRQLASGLSMPIGFKNGTGGSIDIAFDAIFSASNPHVFLGINENSKSSIIETKGNPNLHIILRGGKNSPNYYPECISQVLLEAKRRNLKEKVMVDMSHSNSQKNHKNQSLVCDSICNQIKRGNENIFGVMIESNINEGKQKLISKNNLKWGVSITDACINIKDTDILLQNLFLAVNNRFEVKKRKLVSI